MRTMILLAVVVVGLPLLVFGAAAVLQRGYRRPPALPPPADRDPTTFRNHQLMARELDALLADDMTAVVIPDARKQRIRALLAEYYDDDELGPTRKDNP